MSVKVGILFQPAWRDHQAGDHGRQGGDQVAKKVDKVSKEVDKLVNNMEVGKVANILDNMVVDIDVPNIKYTGVKIQNININKNKCKISHWE